ncbi:MAG: hypothetical protein KAS49_00840 [Candidatus Cloacimonetes bacterium]|nr:hypothetical protein [Candidatus Cloacimonadota bacterium]
MNSKKVAFGIIIRDLTQLSPCIDFLENAEKHNHKITHLLIGYIGTIDSEIVTELEKRCLVITIKIGDFSFLQNSLKNIGLSKLEINTLLKTPHLEKYNLTGYGTARNYVLLTAIFLEIDFLLFFDSDIFPFLLTFDEKNQKYGKEEIDFVGNHLKHLQTDDDIIVTSSDYTGYYIIPQMSFPGLDDLLFGIQKEDRFFEISSLDKPIVANNKLPIIYDTDKILGGNLAINLNRLDKLPPFYSSNLTLNSHCFLGRGEDTLFSPIIHLYGGRCLDIDMKVFHNCFGDFPNKPDINEKKNLDRFYYAAMGWIIRNPFFNWLRSDFFSIDNKTDYNQRYEAIVKGSKAASEFFKDERFSMLPTAFEKSYEKLPEDIKDFKLLLSTWMKMKEKLIAKRQEE